MVRAALVFSLVLLAGCGGIGDLIGADAASHCDFRDATLAKSEPRCQERVNTRPESAELFKQTCNGLGGKSGDGACPREEVVGGCFMGNQGDGSDVNDWYYAPKTKDEAKADCASDDGTFLEP